MEQSKLENWRIFFSVPLSLLIGFSENETEEGTNAIALFDMLQIEDERIPDLSARAGQQSPYLLLQVRHFD